jgi:hypothetical protein
VRAIAGGSKQLAAKQARFHADAGADAR